MTGFDETLADKVSELQKALELSLAKEPLVRKRELRDKLRKVINNIIESRFIKISNKGRMKYFSWDEAFLSQKDTEKVLRIFDEWVFDETLTDKVSVDRQQLEYKDQIIQNLIEQTEAENSKILDNLDEDNTKTSADEARLRSSYWNNGYVQGMKQCRSLFGEAFSQKGSVEVSK